MRRRYKTRFDRMETARLPPRVDDYIDADNPVRAIDAYIERLDLIWYLEMPRRLESFLATRTGESARRMEFNGPGL